MASFGLVDAADVAQQMAARLAQRVVAEQPCLDVHAGEAEALRGEARHLVVGQLGADRQRFEALALFHQPLEPLAVARLDVDHLAETVDQRIEVGDLRRRDLQRVGRVVVGQHDAIAVDDQAAIGHDGHHCDAVVLGLGGKLLVLDDLQVHQPCAEQAEAHEHERGRGQQPRVEARQLLLDVADLGHSGRF